MIKKYDLAKITLILAGKKEFQDHHGRLRPCRTLTAACLQLPALQNLNTILCACIVYIKNSFRQVEVCGPKHAGPLPRVQDCQEEQRSGDGAGFLRHGVLLRSAGGASVRYKCFPARMTDWSRQGVNF